MWAAGKTRDTLELTLQAEQPVARVALFARKITVAESEKLAWIDQADRHGGGIAHHVSAVEGVTRYRSPVEGWQQPQKLPLLPNYTFP